MQHGLAVYVIGRTSFYTGHISKNLCRLLFMFLTSFTSFNDLLLFPLWIIFFNFVYSFNAISSKMDEVISINPFANVFIYGDFNIYHKAIHN